MEQSSAFHIIGISVRTTNEHNQMAQDIPALWNRFLSEGIANRIPGKTSEGIYCIYTDYEKDHTRPYTTILGCRVNNLEDIPQGMTGVTIPAAFYSKRIAKGNILRGSVFNEWMKIWASDLPRTFTADFEVYGKRSQSPEHAEVDIFIAVSNEGNR